MIRERNILTHVSGTFIKWGIRACSRTPCSKPNESGINQSLSALLGIGGVAFAKKEAGIS